MTVPVNASGLPVDMSTADATYGVSSVGSALMPLLSSVQGSLLELSDDEASLVSLLSAQVLSQRYPMELRNAYYEGTFRVPDLGISTPPQMRNLRAALGWPRIAVDALDELINLEGFRYPGSDDLDSDLQAIMSANNMQSESQMAHIDAFVFRAGIVAVGSNEATPELPLISVESPLDFAIQWDARTRRMTAALRLFGFEGSRQATLYLPNQTVSLIQGQGGWIVIDRDIHNLGMVLVQRIVNRSRSYDRDGQSEITPELMYQTDAACRTLLGLEIAREFYSTPQRYILGADESAFQDASGNPKSAWETYIGRVLALERDADGNVPTVGQFTAYDPSAFTKVIDMHARIVSSITGLPPHVLGYTTDNPASADAIRSAGRRLELKADRKTRTFGPDWSAVVQMALLVRDGSLPSDAHQISSVWAATATPTPGATTDAVTKQIQAGYLPATSDVVGEVLGYTPAQRARIEADRLTDAGQSFLNELAHSIGAKDARADMSIAADIGAPKPAVPAQPVTPNATPAS